MLHYTVLFVQDDEVHDIRGVTDLPDLKALHERLYGGTLFSDGLLLLDMRSIPMGVCDCYNPLPF